MSGLLAMILLKVELYKLINIVYLLFILLILLFTFIAGFSVYKKRRECATHLWEDAITTIISQVIFLNNEQNELIEITNDIKKLLQNPAFRNCMINEMIKAKKNLSGSAKVNLKNLYEMLGLDKDSYKKLNNAKFHIKAKGINELAAMEQIKYVKEIFRFTNNRNECVRNEAQCALVCFYDYMGLRFLNIIAYPISQWQQIQLIHKLSNVPPKDTTAVKKWLLSKSESVIVFSLKLATFYSCFDVYDNVMECLQNASLLVKLNALEYLKKMPQPDTADKIISSYSFDNKMYKLAIIDTLNVIGNENQIAFLLKQLNNKDDDLKTAAAKTLAHLHPSGNAFFKTHLFANKYPWKNIFLQITNEHAA